MKSKSIFVFCLCLLLCCSLFLTACNKEYSSQKASADTVTTTSAVSTEDEAMQLITGIETTSEVSTSTEAPTTEAQTTVPKKTTAPQKQETPQQNNDGGNNSSAGPVDSKPMTCTITVGEKDLKAEYGDVLTYTYYLKTPKMIENVQAAVNYTPNCLQLIDDKIETTLPVIHSGAIINTENQGVVKYNAINISGFDFREEGVLITLRFKVIFGGSGAIVNAIEFMDEKGAEVAYVDNFKISDKIKIREELK